MRLRQLVIATSEMDALADKICDLFELKKTYTKELLELRGEILGPEIFAAGVKSLEQSIQPQVITNWMINFLHNAVSS